MNFRPRRLTRVTLADGAQRIYAVGRFVQNNLVSAQWSVISITGEFRKTCFVWNGDNTAFELLRATASDAGLDIAQLPPYLAWHADSDQNAAGFWLGQNTQPASGAYLTLSAGATVIRYQKPPAVTLPYNPDTWCRFCPTVFDDGTFGTHALTVDICASNAQEALEEMPAGTDYIVQQQHCFGEAWNAIQVSDVSRIDDASRLRLLRNAGQQYPNLWVRFDSDADPADLTTYTQRIAWDRFQNLKGTATQKIEVVALVPPSVKDFERIPAPVIERCA